MAFDAIFGESMLIQWKLAGYVLDISRQTHIDCRWSSAPGG